MNMVLLHGSWHGAWCWHKVVPPLEAAGHQVHVPDLPAHGTQWRWLRGRTTLKQMARAVCDLLDPLPEPALLVAHSRGGIVASAVAEMRPDKVAACVYLAAYLLRDGERVADYFRQDKNSLVRRHIQISRRTLTDALPPAARQATLYADCDAADVALAHSLLTPEPSLPALTRLRLTDARYGRVPRHYIELTQDRAVTPELQRRMVAQSPCASVQQIEASHSAYFSQPAALSAAIGRIAADTARAGRV
jgi:pimeloyl-ACP methyl ester carboxylesterase